MSLAAKKLALRYVFGMRRVVWFAALALLGAGAFLLARHGRAVLPSHAFRGWEPATDRPLSLRAGDIVFQTSDSAQCHAIQLATHSALTHVGMIAHAGGRLVVLEAEGTVKTTPLDQWMLRSPQSFVAKRLKESARLLTAEGMGKLAAEGKKQIGKPYDAAFDWSDTRMYCSELVWKVFHVALGIDLSEPKPLRSFDLSSREVRGALARRYGKSVPLDAPMIAPAQIFESELLETVRDDRPPSAQ